VVHLVLSHHGRLEYGSPKVPMTLEALLTHEIDELDSRVNSWLNLMGKEGGSRRWTDSNNVYEQPIWRGTLPTVQAEKKGPPAELLTPVIYVPRGLAPAPAGEGAQRKRPKDRKRPEPREARPAPAQGEAKPDGGAPQARPEGAPAEARPERPERPPRPERPERGPREQRGFGGGGGFGDKKRGYTGPRLPGDKGPHARPPEKKSLTHNPFATLAQKREDAGKPEEKPAETAPAAEQAAAAPESAATEPVQASAPSAEPQAPAETPAPEAKPGE
jgi:3'-5' exoribonuclease